jgi:hypothetical protein
MLDAEYLTLTWVHSIMAAQGSTMAGENRFNSASLLRLFASPRLRV